MTPATLDRRSEELVQEFKERTTRKLSDLRCPRHGRPPRLQFRGATLPEITIRMSGCCEALITLANRKIAEA